MTHAELAMRIGAFTGLLAVVHFAVDFVFQSHAEAMVKHNRWKVRAKHCLIYTAPFVPLLQWIGVGFWQTVVCANVLFWSHFCEDTYLPVFWWAKWMRRPPSMRWSVSRGPGGVVLLGPEEFVGKVPVRTNRPVGTDEAAWREEVVLLAADGKISAEEAQRRLDSRGFLEFVETPLGKILMVAIDQIVHILFLLPVAWYCAQAL